MRLFGFFLVGILFGITLIKSEVASWFRIHEMFRFESFHMYGVIGVAVVLSAIVIAAMKYYRFKTLRNTTIDYSPVPLNIKRHLLVGSIFGLGWALMGACPGPMFAMLGQGFGIFVLAILSAVLGTYTYGIFKEKLPH